MAPREDNIQAKDPAFTAIFPPSHDCNEQQHSDPGRKAGRRARFAVSKDLDASPTTRTYGCFPHLGAGVGSVPGIACSDGYCAFLRLLWAASGKDEHFPGRITRGSPPETFAVTVDPGMTASLHSFLSGTSKRLLVELAIDARQ